jgi:hypothetical protein
VEQDQKSEQTISRSCGSSTTTWAAPEYCQDVSIRVSGAQRGWGTERDTPDARQYHPGMQTHLHSALWDCSSLYAVLSPAVLDTCAL